MDTRTIAGAVGVLTLVLLGLAGLYGVASGYLVGSSGSLELRAPSVGTALVAISVVGALTALGVRGGGRLQTPYW
ncbi:hypothetical protein [Halopiger xanaduensis]|uniref:Uncharacterized protein n=1 Tax=Halopiger xanaduensis (strain DSM 18323 / JCM 14033 / SH-6) TaxID=797210 RepID=F8D6N6_HALXS|nr:hypothetical protein [Halopiger xanaduensis]AEH37776.1 hypothetical protein Halxa_3163 [Halopiger xanaduensis SH-6]